MDAKGALSLICFCFLTFSTARCETLVEPKEAPIKVEEKSSAVPAQPDPYKDVTWDSALNKNNEQKSEVTVFNARSKDADFYTVTSTGTNGASQTGVVVAAPTGRRTKRWFWD